MVKMKKILIFILTLALGFQLFACEAEEVNLNDQYFDSVTKTLALTKVYEGKDFINEGIGKATIVNYIDGDTARYKLESGETITARYYQINTPESTGNVEKWGKAASVFAKEQLSKATEIVLEATKEKAEHDSYGVRYLAYVWYKTSDSGFKCLNLELVENGFSNNNGIDTSEYPYYSYFKKANDFARSKKLRIYSSFDDPLYSTDPVDMTLKEFESNQDLFYSSDTDAGAKVRVILTLTNLYIASSGTHTFTGTEYDPETGESRSINIYAGYSSATASKMKVGHLYEIIGNIQNYYGTFQISGILYDTIYEVPGYSKIVQRNYYYIFNSDTIYKMQFSACLFSNITVKEVSVGDDGFVTFVGEAYQKINPTDEKEYSDTATRFAFKVAAPSSGNTINVGDTISLTGYQFVKDSGIINIPNYSNISKK